MDRVKLTTDLSISQLVYGMWRIADDENTSPDHVARKIDLCLDQGITTIDQADIYGDYGAESVLGTALLSRPELRSKIEIVSKCDIVAPIGHHRDKSVKYYDTSRAHIEASVQRSLREMNTDYIDLLLIHRPDPLMDHRETGATLDDLVRSGKVRAVGVSNFKPHDWQLLQSAMSTKLATNQLEISLGEISPFTNGDIAFHQQHDQPMMAWSPLGGGVLMGDQSKIAPALHEIAQAQNVDRAAVAVAFLIHHPAVIVPVLGTNNLERISKISEALDVRLDREQWFTLYQSALGREVA